jgi:hypothetical protein
VTFLSESGDKVDMGLYLHAVLPVYDYVANNHIYLSRQQYVFNTSPPGVLIRAGMGCCLS